MKKQMVIRTYPHNYTNSVTALSAALKDGWIVVMCNATYLEQERTCWSTLSKKMRKLKI